MHVLSVALSTCAELYDPSTQVSQAAWNVSGIFPGWHAEQVTAPGIGPAMGGSMELTWFAGHASHADWPVVLANRPKAHSVHSTSELTSAKRPSSQFSHAVAPVIFWPREQFLFDAVISTQLDWY